MMNARLDKIRPVTTSPRIENARTGDSSREVGQIFVLPGNRRLLRIGIAWGNLLGDVTVDSFTDGWPMPTREDPLGKEERLGSAVVAELQAKIPEKKWQKTYCFVLVSIPTVSHCVTLFKLGFCSAMKIPSRLAAALLVRDDMWPVVGWCFGNTQVDSEVRAWMTCLDTLTYLGPWRWRRHSHRFTMSWRAKPPKSREDSGEDSWKLSYGPSSLDDPHGFAPAKPALRICMRCWTRSKPLTRPSSAWEFWSHSCGFVVREEMGWWDWKQDHVTDRGGCKYLDICGVIYCISSRLVVDKFYQLCRVICLSSIFSCWRSDSLLSSTSHPSTLTTTRLRS